MNPPRKYCKKLSFTINLILIVCSNIVPPLIKGGRNRCKTKLRKLIFKLGSLKFPKGVHRLNSNYIQKYFHFIKTFSLLIFKLLLFIIFIFLHAVGFLQQLIGIFQASSVSPPLVPGDNVFRIRIFFHYFLNCPLPAFSISM